MADDIRRLKHTAAEIDEAIDMLLEVYTREEIDEKISGITEEITAIKNRLTALENPETEVEENA